MAGDHEVERQSGNLHVRERRVEMRTRGDQRADQVVGWFALAAPDRLKEVVLERDGSLGVSQPFLDRSGLLDEEPIVAPNVQLSQILARQSQQLAENTKRQRPGEGADQFDLAGRRQLAEEVVNDAPDDGLEGGDAPRRESLGREFPNSIVERRINLDDVGHLGVALRQNGGHLIGKRRRLERAGRGKRVVILEDGKNVVVAGNDPEIEGGYVKDGLVASRGRQDIEWILPLLWRQRVEARRGDRRAHTRRHCGLRITR